MKRIRRTYRHVRHTKVGQAVRYASWRARGRVTLLADRIELKLSPKYAGIFHRLRGFNPVTLGGFAFRAFRKDPVFLAGYGTWSLGISNLQLPLMLSLGFNPLLTLGVRLLTGTPVDLGVMWWRQHTLRKRKDPSLTPMGTLRQLGGEYKTFSEHRRSRTRRFMRRDERRRQRQGVPAAVRQNPLRALAAPLVGALAAPR